LLEHCFSIDYLPSKITFAPYDFVAAILDKDAFFGITITQGIFFVHAAYATP
jgi:hypothetical protein